MFNYTLIQKQLKLFLDFHVDNIILMHLLVAFILLLGCCGSITSTGDDPLLILFTNDGKFYRLNISEKTVQWYGALSSKLISFETSEIEQNFTYFLPTIDGNFLYIDANHQLKIARQQVQKLLDICFQGAINKSSQYFVYENYQYYVLDIENGSIEELEKFIANGKVISQSNNSKVILSIQKKFLKQLSLDLSIRWSAVSSNVNIISIQDFFKNPHIKPVIQQSEKYLLERTDARSLYIVDKKDGSVFDMESSSSVMSIFQYKKQQNQFVSLKVFNKQKKLLALGDKSDKKHSSINKIKQSIKNKDNDFDKTITEIQTLNIQKHQTGKKTNKNSPLQFCINSFRAMNRIDDGPTGQVFRTLNFQDKNRNIYPSFAFTYGNQHHQPYIPKQQPLAYVFIIGIFMMLLVIISKLRLRKLLKQVNALKQSNNSRIDELQRKISEKFAKQKLVEKPQNKTQETHSVDFDQLLKKTDDYLLYQGKFLNQPSKVYIVQIQNHGDLVEKLQILLKVTSKGFCKLFYYTSMVQQLNKMELKRHKNNGSEIMAIYCQRSQQILNKNALQRVLKNQHPNQIIFNLLSNLIFMSDKFDIQRVLLESIMIDDNELKVDMIPNMLVQHIEQKILVQNKEIKQVHLQQIGKQNTEPQNYPRKLSDEQTQVTIKSLKVEKGDSLQTGYKYYDLQKDLVSLFYYIEKNGQEYDESYLDQNRIVKGKFKDHEFLFKDFLSYVFDQSEEDLDNLLNAIKQHPYLWNEKQTTLFIMDFSNYVQTHVDDEKLKKLEKKAKQLAIIRVPWVKQLDQFLTKQITNHRKYDYSSIRDLIRVIRNKVSHFHELPKQLRNIVGKNPDEFVQYFLNKFPKLLPFMFVYSRKKKWKLHSV